MKNDEVRVKQMDKAQLRVPGTLGCDNELWRFPRAFRLANQNSIRVNSRAFAVLYRSPSPLCLCGEINPNPYAQPNFPSPAYDPAVG
jgi:hypothetical protein